MKYRKKFLSAVLALALAVPGASMPAEVRAAESNLALSGTTTGSSYESGTEYTPAKATDGNTSAVSRWGTNQNAAAGEWLQVDLGSSSTISRIVINFERADADQNITGYHVDIDDETVYTKTERAAQVETITFNEPKTGSVVKLVIDSADGGTLNWVNVGVTEFQIFGESDESELPPTEGALTNLALGKTAVADSAEASTVAASNAVDGDTTSRTSRWGSGTQGAPHWIYVDLGEEKSVQSVRIIWEQRKPTAYRIQTSDDASTWTDAKVINARPAALDDVIVFDEAVEARYIRLYIDSYTPEDPDGGTTWSSVSIFEMEVYNGVFVKPIAPIDMIEVNTPQKGNKKLEVNIPDSSDYTITYNGTDFEQVIGDDLTIYEPIVDKTVNVSFKLVNNSNASDYEFKEIEVTVPGTYTQEAGDNKAPAVLPELAEWKGYTGTFEPADEAKVVIASDDLKAMADAFAADYMDITGKELTVAKGTAEDANMGDFFFTLITEDRGLDEEGYLMEIEDIVTVEAENATGAYWATRTILQALKSGDMTIPKGITRDYPLYKVRGIILDVGRKTFKLDFLQQMAKQMSWYKMNDFHVHLNDNLIFLEDCRSNGLDPTQAYSGFRLESNVVKGDTVELKSVENGVETTKVFTYQADLTSKDVFYSKADFRSFMQNAAVVGVNIVPEFDTPAHALAFTKVIPELSLGESVRNGRGLEELDLTDQYEESFDFVTNVFDEYMAADMENPVFTEGGIVHVGCDEYFGDTEGFRKYCRDMADYVESTGRTARMWGSLSAKRGNTVVDGAGIQMNMWSASYALADEMYVQGFDMIDCNEGPYYIVPNAGYYNDYLSASNMYNDEVNNIAGVDFPAGDKQILGGSYALWNDMIDLYDNGISEYDCYKRLTTNMGLFAAKVWGKGELSQKEAAKLNNLMGDAPNTNFGYKVEADKHGNVLSWDTEAFSEFGSENVNIQVEDDVEAVKLNGGASYLQTGYGTVGLNSALTVKVKRISESTEDQILFESAYGSIKAVQGTTGKVGITRENRDYSFDYELPVGEWVELTIKNSFEVVSLYVNDELEDIIGDDETHSVTKYNGNVTTRPILATCMLPVDVIGSRTDAFEGYISSVSVTTEPERDYYKGQITVTASSEETISEDGAAANVVDGDTGTIWHSNYSGTAVTPHWIELELEKVTSIDSFVYVPRSGGGTNGIVTQYVLKVSTDGVTYQEAASGTWAENSAVKTIEFAEVLDAKYIRLEIVDSMGGFASAAEIKVRLPIAEEEPEMEVCEIFEDVLHGAWYEAAIQYAYDAKIMTGTGADTFEPETDVTRAMVVETLYKMEGRPDTSEMAVPEIVDYQEGAWWADALKWAMANGIATGDTNTKAFNAEQAVTREQLATFLYRYADYKGLDTASDGSKDEILGNVPISNWAKPAFTWAVEEELITGFPAGEGFDFSPQRGANRAQLATILMRFCDTY